MRTAALAKHPQALRLQLALELPPWASRRASSLEGSVLFDEFRGFQDREAAGRELASHLRRYSGRRDVVVLGLPRGGVPVACEVAEALGVPLDLFVVRKLGTPGHPELAMGAIGSGGARVLNEDVIRAFGISDDAIAEITRREQDELERAETVFREGHPTLLLGDQAVILVDDGMATGASMLAAIKAVREHRPARVVVAVPVGALAACDHLRGAADEVVCARTPEPFSAVGEWYVNFEQVSDEQVQRLLRRDLRLAGIARPRLVPRP